MERQYREIKLPLEVRDISSEEDDFIIEGYFALFNQETELWPGYFESIDPNAFTRTLKEQKDIKALFDHNQAIVIGRTTSTTLELRVDEKGLFGKIKINKNDTEALNIYYRVKRKDIDQCSFGFVIIKEVSEQRNDNTVHTVIKDLELYEVSIVTFPAYENTSVQARKKDFENSKRNMHDAWKKKILERIK